MLAIQKNRNKDLYDLYKNLYMDDAKERILFRAERLSLCAYVKMD